MSYDDIKLRMQNHRDFFDKVEDRIYHDDWHRAFPEPEWVEELILIARRYMRLYEESLKEIEVLKEVYKYERE